MVTVSVSRYFTLELLQAINDWQRGGDHKQKLKRGGKLKKLAAALPEQYRTCSEICYRQEAHEKDRIWQLLADESLPETIAAWTTDLSIARNFKNGVPPDGLRGVIFSIVPPSKSVVINLIKIYGDPGFKSAIEQHKRGIDGFDDGIGRYGVTQREIVLELHKLGPETIHCYGGYASGRETLAQQFFGHKSVMEVLLVMMDGICQASRMDA
ncbi:hypothetical protein [Magnetospirillum sp. SS-4]|uniref:hypothetical protein n=1 Tax=Magnetospirillum sp. SS-4 TaxID=2681465 RepID=UPI001385A5AC|nr:hypothetical protein [Magnetospirillum sp. SS-4]CAA7627269.1 conserved hypothetical protein [Magnetospirillum sp. SS-4]